jgi:hypothetical protein
MSKNKFECMLVATFVATSFLSPSLSYSQTTTARKIQTPNTSSELKSDTVDAKPEEKTTSKKKEEVEEKADDKEAAPSGTTSAAPRRLQQHGLGLGLGQTTLFGDYGKHGQDKITVDLLYSYAASYSFDLLVDAHMSKHKDNSESMKLMALTGSIKGRVFEYDNFSPFLLGGLGFYAPQADRIGTGKTAQKVTFGLNFGGGVDLRLNDEFVIGAMAQMHCPFKVQQDRGSDLRGYYLKMMLTGMYLF